MQQGEAFALPSEVIDAFRGVLLDADLDPAFIAEMLTLPSENEIAGWYKTVDVDAIHQVVGELENTFAREMQDEFSAIYHSLTQAAYSVDHDAWQNVLCAIRVWLIWRTPFRVMRWLKVSTKHQIT
ncbi:membrane alanine aminopeptidase N [Photobacterium aphoticum]|uniref:Membrane alanine aminopeptidase N n=1 Tax=Photobacterium aphoticum TaxID=754436 RepID=A0A090QMV4_9GAMM|nr:membrane alanine aminopeptidase N [Photobacterium aphoticum]